MKNLTKIVALLLAAVMMLALCACGQQTAPAPSGGSDAPAATAAPRVEKKFMTIAAPPSTSALYTYFVAIGKAIQDTYPEYNLTVSESQGIADIINKISNGDAIIGNSTTAADYELYFGTGSYADKQNQDARVLWYYDVTPIQIAVAVDTGIQDIYELEGQKFNPGATGGATAQAVTNAFAVLGLQPAYFEATQGDAADAYGDRQIVGTTKQGSAPDSFVLQLNTARDVRLLSFTDEDLAKIAEQYPYLTPTVIPANTYDFADYDVKTFQVVGSVQTTTELPQEDGYKFIKAVFEGSGYDSVVAAYPATGKYDLVDLLLSSACSKLHAGTVQYLTELGVEVPANLIPDEYVPVA
ncbi:MAG: TAXI family TRAP transporter solute-binding subunit [Oscillospiraceae bacterium]|nr:TAXI family TRAP transporter solute-binding subunit [Oscillospiraceae bacterium]